MPTTKLRAPASYACCKSSPTPYVLVTRGSRLSLGTSASPAAIAISITAVDPPSISPYSASTGSPSGPRTRSVCRSPRVAATSAPTVPSPPSAIGTSTNSASRMATRTPSPIASPASTADSDPLKALGATTMRISASPAKEAAPSVDRCQPVAVLGAVSPDDVEVELLELAHHWPDLAIADRPAVDIDHG